MPLKSDAHHWGSLAKTFHWLVVLLIIVQGALGLYMVELPKTPGAFPYYNLHKSIGLSVLALAALRLAWRAFDPRPQEPASMPHWQVLGTRAGHALLYVLLFLVPLSGWWFDSVTALRPVYFFGLFEVPHIAAPNPGLKELAHEAHEWGFWLLVVVALGHAAAAFVHEFVDKDGTLSRMLPGRKNPLRGLAYAIAALLVLGGFAYVLQKGSTPDSGSGAAAATETSARNAADAGSAALARAWQVDAAQSSLTFTGTYSGDGFDGKFKKFDATINYDEAALAASKFDVSVDVASVDTASSERDDSLKGDDFFAPAKFPQAHFVTESFAKSADGGVEAKGRLTIRDQTRPVTLKVKFAASGPSTGSGQAATLDVDTVLKRTDFGLGTGSDWKDIGTDVPVHGHLVLTGK